MSEIKDSDVNPQTGRDRKGRFAPGNLCGSGKRKQSEVTKDLRAYANANNLTLMAVKRLEMIAENKKGSFSESAQLKACETLLKHFNVTVEKDIDKEIEDDKNATLSEMFNTLKGIAKE
ncbi:hypothetical protein QUQ16_000180 [Escherichia coli]|nr:hypothetical protein [Escherichia coli]